MIVLEKLCFAFNYHDILKNRLNDHKHLNAGQEEEQIAKMKVVVDKE